MVQGLKRNAAHIHKGLKRLPDGQVIALKPCQIYIPHRFTEVNLATISGHVEMAAIYGIVMDGYYGTSLTNAIVKSKPSSTRVEKIDDTDYYIFGYEKGDVVFMDSRVVTMDVLVYHIWAEMIDKGKVPWYMDAEDRSVLLMTAKSHANVSIGSNYSLIEMIMSVCTRNSEDRTEQWRYTLNKKGGVGKSEPVAIGLRNIQFTAETDLARLSGSYAEVGLMSAIVRPGDNPEGLEKIVLL